MPYIIKEQRNHLNKALAALSDALDNILPEAKAGALNFCFTRLLNSTYPEKNYRAYNETIGILECCKQEFYRRAVVPYEKKKIEINGDVF